MIPGFTQRIRTDFVDTVKYLRGKEIPEDADEKKKLRMQIGLSATRIFSTLGMVISGISAIKAVLIVGSNPISALFLLALGAALFVASHDVFIMAKNTTENMSLIKQVQNELKGLFDHVKAVLTGTKSLNEPLLHPCTKDTFFPAFWSARIEKLLNAQKASAVVPAGTPEQEKV